MLFPKILIANRGEIACRIIRTAKKHGIKTVAVFSAADCNALHVKQADEAYLIGPAASQDSYLNIEKIIAITKESKAAAIHPGYGFLAENSQFAKRCEQENIIFIGPSSSVIALMANKNVAKEKMQQHAVPVLSGFYDESQSSSNLLAAAKKMGFPVLLKAIAGGGGKGLRLVQHEHEFDYAYSSARREALSFFEDDRILLEKYLPHARHIEVQILADHFGQVQPLFTRDCSIQRRHQKIIEEAPAPSIAKELEEKMMAMAVRAAAVIQYTNAGTLEFLLEKDAFYFMEMNTRLQVEHPVTEMITGIDLVEWQIRVAAGEPLFTALPPSKGHSIEVRLNAEDPENNFQPSSGKLHYFHLPDENKHVRIDRAYEKEDKIDIYYDSLLAKLIVWGETRVVAIRRLEQLLDNTFILGIKTNLSLLKAIIKNDNFVHADINTHFLQKESLCLAPHHKEIFYAIGSVFLNFLQRITREQDTYSPWLNYDAWQLFSPRSVTFYFRDNQERICAEIRQTENFYTVNVRGHLFDCFILTDEAIGTNSYQFELIVNNQRYGAKIFRNGTKLELIIQGEYCTLEVLKENSQHLNHECDEAQQLHAPMPGTIVALWVKPGQQVAKGDKLLVIEAMKMEQTIYAPREGTIKQCHYKVGDLIEEGAELIEFE
jgi:3-methylcrotonyl-CoA carboxylase alpha subunit